MDNISGSNVVVQAVNSSSNSNLETMGLTAESSQERAAHELMKMEIEAKKTGVRTRGTNAST